MRLIDFDALVDVLMTYTWRDEDERLIDDADEKREYIKQWLPDLPTVGGWISVKDRIPEEHPSMFASFYGSEKWNNAMWRNESDRVLVTILFPDGTRTVDKGKLQDGKWKTGVSPVLPQEVTHWAVWPEPPKEVKK